MCYILDNLNHFEHMQLHSLSHLKHIKLLIHKTYYRQKGLVIIIIIYSIFSYLLLLSILILKQCGNI